MNDKELEKILAEIGKAKIEPSKDIVDDTISFIKNKYIYYIVLVSIISYIAVILGTITLGYKYLGLKATIFLLCISHFIGLLPALGVIIASRNNKKGEINYEK